METKICQNCKQEFRIEPEDFAFYEKIKVPPPTFCPECRMIRRMVWRSDRFLFRVPDAATGKEIFSGMSPRIPVKIYKKEYWWSDGWEPMDYGRDYDFSPFAYNETIAQDFFPLTKEEAEAKGFLWRDAEQREYQTTIDAKDLPDRISDVQDSLLKEIIKCAGCGKAYRIIQMELQFLRQMSLPLPRMCPNCRHTERLKLRNAPRFYHRRCTCGGSTSENGTYANQAQHLHGASHCPNEFETSYAPDRTEIVYCEQCYQQEVA